MVTKSCWFITAASQLKGLKSRLQILVLNTWHDVEVQLLSTEGIVILRGYQITEQFTQIQSILPVYWYFINS